MVAVFKAHVHATVMLVQSLFSACDIVRGHGTAKKISLNSQIIVSSNCWYNILETYLGCWDCLRTVNLQTYCQTLPLQRINNVPKLAGVLRLIKQIQEPTISSPNELLKFSCEIAGFTTATTK